jgi:flagellar protein FlaG
MSSEIQGINAVAAPQGGDSHRFAVSAAATAFPAEPERTAEPEGGLQQALEAIDRYLAENRSGLEFRVDKDLGRVIVSIVDADGKVLRQIPGEEALRLARLLAKDRNGLIDARA